MLKVEIGTIDMNGYCGREHHPKASDGDQIAEVVSVETIEEMDEEEMDEQLYTVALNDGRTVELVECEIKRIWIDTGEPDEMTYHPTG